MVRSNITVGTHKLAFYERAGAGPCVALVSGGPGLPSLYMRESHRTLAAGDLRVITWDQLGCGASDRPNTQQFYCLAYYVDEFEQVRAAADVDRLHVVGHSWGGILAVEYALAYPQRVASLVIVSIACDANAMNVAMNRVRAALGSERERFMSRCETEGAMGLPEYEMAIDELNRRHMCRCVPWPDSLAASFADFNRQVSDPILGPVFFRLGGELATYNRLGRLRELTMPSAFIVGEHDFVGVEAVRQSAAAVPGSRFLLMRGCSHMPMFEQPDGYMSRLRDCLQLG